MSSQEEVVEALEELISALAVARAEMRRAQLAMGRALKRIAGGETIESLIVLQPPAEKRKAFLEALEDVHRTRHAARQKVFTYAQVRGLTIAELARAWGISRQLASRYLKEESLKDDSAAAPTSAGVGVEFLAKAPVVQQAEALLDGIGAIEDGDA
jgi:DNA invertase Pin-like site-specific DNA recombinase